MLEKDPMTDFAKKSPYLGQIISGTKCERDNPILSAEKGFNKIKLGTQETQRDLKMSKNGVNPEEVPYQLQVWEYPLREVTRKLKPSFLLKRNGPNDLNKMISKVYVCKMGQGE